MLASLEDTLTTLLDDVRRAHPSIDLDASTFVRYLAPRTPEEGTPTDAIAAMPRADLYLACAALEGDAAATTEIARRTALESRAALRRIDPSPHFAEEASSLLLDRLLLSEGGAPPKLSAYAGSGPLSAWIRVAALRTGLSLKRQGRREVELDEPALEALADSTPQQDILLAQRRHKTELSDAFREALATLGSRERNLLRMYYGSGVKLERLATMHRVNVSTVSRWLARAREDVLESTRRQLAAKLRLSLAEVESLLGLAISIDASLGGFLAESSEG